jgi:predicted transposase YbfD/YdcC
MTTKPSVSLTDHFASLPDPRVRRTRRHELFDIIAIALCAVISGAESWDDVADYGRRKYDWLRTFLTLPHGIPSHDTFNRLFQRLNPEAFQACFLSWMRALAEALGLKVIAIDGKALRRSFDTASAKSALHLVSAWATANGVTLGQVATDAKSNEITAIPRLLELLDLAGAIVTIDAMGCQKEVAAQIRDGGGDYVLAVKDNQPHLHDDIINRFTQCLDDDFAGVEHSTFEEVEQGHGRQERRATFVIHSTEGVRDAARWRDLSTLCMVVSGRTVGGESTSEARYYIGSRRAPAQAYAGAIRGHWGIENSLHWVLDVQFREDDSRVRAGHTAENLALLRRIAVSLLRNEKSCKRGVHGKRLIAGWDNDYLLQVLQGFPDN